MNETNPKVVPERKTTKKTTHTVTFSKEDIANFLMEHPVLLTDLILTGVTGGEHFHVSLRLDLLLKHLVTYKYLPEDVVEKLLEKWPWDGVSASVCLGSGESIQGTIDKRGCLRVTWEDTVEEEVQRG